MIDVKMLYFDALADFYYGTEMLRTIEEDRVEATRLLSQYDCCHQHEQMTSIQTHHQAAIRRPNAARRNAAGEGTEVVQVCCVAMMHHMDMHHLSFVLESCWARIHPWKMPLMRTLRWPGSKLLHWYECYQYQSCIFFMPFLTRTRNISWKAVSQPACSSRFMAARAPSSPQASMAWLW